MTIVRNYSDLTPAMRAGLSHWNTARAATRKALIARGLVADYRGDLTAAGERARDHILADVPPKIAPHLDRARQLGLDVKRESERGTIKSWTISTPNPIDRTQVWLYWSPGARGGRLAATLYCGPSTKTKRPPLRHIWYIIQSMAESLARHHGREAAKLQSQQAATKVTMAEAQAALGQVFAELEGAVLPAASNLLHEELNLSTVHANDGTDRPACGAPILGGEMAAVDYPVDCQGCLRQRILDCGCPAQIVTDEGHQEGCSLGAQVDPARPGWFLVGQHIYDRPAQVHAYVAAVQHRPDGRIAAVAVTVQGGYAGKWYWYGEHPDSIGGLDRLDGPHIGLAGDDRRIWPSHAHSALTAVRRILVDQVLSGFALIGGATVDTPACVLVNIPDGTDPTRHLILLQRYVPYLATVELRSNPARHDRYPTIAITPSGPR